MLITIVAIARDEGKYIAEWIAHHLSIGVDHIAVYNNESQDHTGPIIENMGRTHPVECLPWKSVEGVSPQLAAYNDALSRFRGKTDIIGFIDIDEFIIPTNGTTFKDIIGVSLKCHQEVGAICINQRVFGANDQQNYFPEPVMKRFRKCSIPENNENKWVKTLFVASCVSQITGVHSSPLMRGIHIHASGTRVEFDGDTYSQTKNIDLSALQLNHYITKSFEEFTWKRQRGGGAASTIKARASRYQIAGFFEVRQGKTYHCKDLPTEVFAETIETVVSKYYKDLT